MTASGYFAGVRFGHSGSFLTSGIDEIRHSARMDGSFPPNTGH